MTEIPQPWKIAHFSKNLKTTSLPKCHVPIHLRHALDLVMTDYILKLLTKDNDLLTKNFHLPNRCGSGCHGEGSWYSTGERGAAV